MQRVDLGQAKEFKDPVRTTLEGLEAATMDLVLLVLFNGLPFVVAGSVGCFSRQDATPGSVL